MAELSEFPSASAKDTIAFCWRQVDGHKRALVTSWVVMVLAVVTADIVCPLIFAGILSLLIIVLILNAIVSRLEKHVARWRPDQPRRS